MKWLCILGLHAWDGCKCNTCGKVRDKYHSWEKCKCSKCGATKGTGHEDHDYDDHWCCRNCGKSSIYAAKEELIYALVDVIGPGRFAEAVLPRGISAVVTKQAWRQGYDKLWSVVSRIKATFNEVEISEEIFNHYFYSSDSVSSIGYEVYTVYLWKMHAFIPRDPYISLGELETIIGATSRNKFTDAVNAILDMALSGNEFTGTEPSEEWEDRLDNAIDKAFDE